MFVVSERVGIIYQVFVFGARVLQCCVTGQIVCHCVAGYLLAAKFHSAKRFCVGVLVLEIVLNVRNSLVLKTKKGVCVCVFSDLEVNVLCNSVAVVAILGGTRQRYEE